MIGEMGEGGLRVHAEGRGRELRIHGIDEVDQAGAADLAAGPGWRRYAARVLPVAPCWPQTPRPDRLLHGGERMPDHQHRHLAAVSAGPAGFPGRWWLCGHAIGDATVLELHGEFDLASTLLARGRVMAAMDAAEADALLDLRPATFFDCSGSRLLLFAHQRLRTRSGRLRMVCDHVLTLRLLHVTGIAAVLRPAPTIADAFTPVAADGPPAGRRSGR
ncbi:STAS domain-containing protein [Streptomyces rimosus]|uniref:STAS domain-containing protein n=1 Tax=Streptomyces rimosus TaxID=1927 RepID=UPI00067D3CA3|nr:STAS domain-containing protein [Streptomyces rimosus]